MRIEVVELRRAAPQLRLQRLHAAGGGAAQALCERARGQRLCRGVGTARAQFAIEIAQAPALRVAPVRPCPAQALREVSEFTRLRGDALARMHQPARKAVELLHAALEAAQGDLPQALRVMAEFLQEFVAPRTDELGRRRRCRRTAIGDEVGDREVGFVADAAHHRERAGVDRARHCFLVEGPQVLEAGRRRASSNRPSAASFALSFSKAA